KLKDGGEGNLKMEVKLWHTLKEDGSKYRLTFMLDRKELTLILDDFKTIFHLPQATHNNYDQFVPSPKFSDMTLCKIFSKCLTTHVTGWDQPPLQIMQMMYCFINNIHVDYAELLREGFHYSLKHPTTLIMYPRFTKIIGRHRTLSASRSPKPKMDVGDSSVQKKSTIIHLCLRFRRSTRLTPPTSVLMIDEANDMILQDTIQLSLIEQKSQKELEAKKNVKLVKKHLASEEIEKLVKGTENVKEDSLIPRNDDQHILGTRLEPRSDNESPEVEITADVQPVNVLDEEEESAYDDVYELKRRAKGKQVEETRNTPSPSPIRSTRI
nr:hypothetical protein [Tanacetum cinerariifolium]